MFFFSFCVDFVFIDWIQLHIFSYVYGYHLSISVYDFVCVSNIYICLDSNIFFPTYRNQQWEEKIHCINFECFTKC